MSEYLTCEIRPPTWVMHCYGCGKMIVDVPTDGTDGLPPCPLCGGDLHLFPEGTQADVRVTYRSEVDGITITHVTSDNCNPDAPVVACDRELITTGMMNAAARELQIRHLIDKYGITRERAEELTRGLYVP